MRKLLSFLALLLTAQFAQAQCSAAVPGRLSGNASPMSINANGSVTAPVFTTSPSGLPNTEFLFTNKDQEATDGGGAAIVLVDVDGAAAVADIGVSTCQRFAVTPVSYDIHQLRAIIHAILTGSTTTPFPTTCCQLVDLQFQGFCDSLNAAGIYDSTDVNSLADFFTLIEVVAGPGSTISIGGAQSTIQLLNGSLSFLGSCSGGVSEICFAVDTTGSDLYAVAGPTASSLMIDPQNALIVGSSGQQQFTAAFMPMGACPQPLSWSIVGSSANVSIDAMTGLATATGYDTVQIAVISFQDTMLRDTATLIVRAQQVGVENSLSSEFIQMRPLPNPFTGDLSVQISSVLSQAEASVQLLDIVGQQVHTQTLQIQNGSQTLQLPTAHLPAGVYMLRLQTQGEQILQRVLKQ